jgi:ATP/maltotriose-dependent transcriptional regulator MalT
LGILRDDIQAYGLEFARPYADWTTALVKLGLRRFGEAERWLQSVEDAVAVTDDSRHSLNARMLRTRLLLQSGKSAEAADLVSELPDGVLFAAWAAEYIGTRALALACTHQTAEATEAVRATRATSNGIEAAVLAAAAEAVIAAQRGDAAEASTLLKTAATLGAWDPVVCALRASSELADALASHDPSRGTLESLYVASHDLGLARRAGFRTRATRAPDELLTPRESEVLGLIARGLKNRDIANALYISQSTAKVHVRHVFEKLGVRTRSEAVARYEIFSAE